MIVGFASDDTAYTEGTHIPSPEKTDMGFAVFETENGGYLLKDWQVCPGAAQTPSRIVTAGTAVLGDAPTDANTYDVILSSNPYLHTVKRAYYKGDTLLGEAKHLADISYSMLMLPWDAYPEADRVSQYFYDAQGRKIDPDTGVITEADGTVVHQPSYTYGCGNWKVTLPGEYVHLLLPYNVSQETSPGHFTLTSVYEKTSVEEATRDFGSSDGMGFLFGITMLEGEAYQSWLDEDFAGYTLFARDDAGRYFFRVEATDVRYYRSDHSKGNYADWEALMALAKPTCETFITLNVLTPYTRQEALADLAAPTAALVGEALSPYQRYEIRLNGVNTGVTSGGLYTPETFTIHERNSGAVLLQDIGYFKQTAVWSPDGTYLALARSARNYCFITIIETDDWTAWNAELRMPDGSAMEEYLFLREYKTLDTGMRWLSAHELQVSFGPSVDQTYYQAIVNAAAPTIVTLNTVR